MKTMTEFFVVQNTNNIGEWIDVCQFRTKHLAEHKFREWCGLRSDFFFVRLIRREVFEESLLEDHVLGGES